MQTLQTKIKEEWIHILTKGIITIPKKMREQIDIKEGDIVKIKIEGNSIVIEPKSELSLNDVRSFSRKELERWIKKDELPIDLTKETANYWKDLP